MMAQLWRSFWLQRRPSEGWLPLGLLLLLLSCLLGAVLEADWVPEDGVTVPAALGGLALGLLLAKRPLSPLPAWILLALHGLLLNTVWLGQLLPPLNVVGSGWGVTAQFWRSSGALFADRVAGWFQALFSGGYSAETVVFALGLGLLAWLLAAFAAWSTYRQHSPLQGAATLGFMLALNLYFGAASTYWAAIFVGLTAIFVSLAHFRFLELGWQETAVDYSPEIRFDLAMHAGAIALVLLIFALILPGFSIKRMGDFLARQPMVQEVEQTWERVFSGVRPPMGADTGSGAGGPGGSGALPRAILLGDAPELRETVVMTAVVTTMDGTLLDPAEMAGLHWRGLSYETYTGRGWTISPERVEELPAGTPIALPPWRGQTPYHQTVHWLVDQRVLRYTLGLPLQFDAPVTLRWRGLADLVRVQGSGISYGVTTTLSSADAAQLRQAALHDVSPVIMARYTALPPDVPPRVSALAQEVAGPYITPYDQALALEQFLRQYPYSLDVPLPPPGADVVEYFLFEAQVGYCDYYASAMVVMARSLGLPARLAVGFLAQPPDEQGVQVVRQIHGHSWAEVYFAGYGWVEFEPTAGFAVARETAVFATPFAPTEPSNPFAATGVAYPLPLPQADSATFAPGRWWRWGVVALLGALLVGVWRWQVRRQAVTGIPAVYGRFRRQALKLGAPAQASLTPQEFAASFLRHLEPWATHPRLLGWVQALQEPVFRMTAVFEQWQYAPPMPPQEEDETRQLWAKMRRPLWLLWLARRWYGR